LCNNNVHKMYWFTNDTPTVKLNHKVWYCICWMAKVHVN
jgi:hypothetical protein